MKYKKTWRGIQVKKHKIFYRELHNKMIQRTIYAIVITALVIITITTIY